MFGGWNNPLSFTKMNHTTHWNDPRQNFLGAAAKLHSLWLAWTYPFASIAKDVSIHYSSDLSRSSARHIQIGKGVIIAKHAWLHISDLPNRKAPAIILEDGCGVQRRCTIAVRNQVHIERNTIFGPGALVTDHAFAFADEALPDDDSLAPRGGRIRIEQGCWIGYGAAIVCEQGDLVIGRHSIIGANSVVTKSVPAYSIVSGNPGRVVKQYDFTSKRWVLGSREAHARGSTTEGAADTQRTLAP